MDEKKNEIQKKYSIAELEALLDNEESEEFEILPNGDVVKKGDPGFTEGEKKFPKPLTMRENLGGEY